MLVRKSAGSWWCQTLALFVLCLICSRMGLSLGVQHASEKLQECFNCKPCQYVYIIMYQIAMYQLYLHKHTNTTCLKNKHKHTNMYTNYIYIQMKYIWTNVWYTNVSYRQQGAQILAWRAANEEVDTQQGWCHGVPFVADKTPSFLLWEDRDTWEQMANIWVSLLDVSSLLLINFHGEHMSQADGNLSLRFL